MPVRITDTCNCLNCAHLYDHYWISATMHIIKCRNISSQIETRTYHALDKHWCLDGNRRKDRKIMADIRNKIIDRIQKLLKLAGGTTYGAEAENAILQAQRLMAENHLSEYEVREKPKGNVIEEKTDIGSRNTEWRRSLSMVIANNFRCKTYYTTGIRGCSGTIIKFLGEEQDARIALTVFNAAQSAALIRWKDYKKENEVFLRRDPHGNKARIAFLEGFVSGLRMKFKEQKNSNAEWGLVLATPQSVLDKYGAMKIRIVKCKQMAISDGNAYGAGFEEGESFNPDDQVLVSECAV